MKKILSILIVIFLSISSISVAQNNSKEREFKLGSEERTAIIDTIITYFNKLYVYPEIAKKYELHLRKQLKNKAYERITNISVFTDQLTKDMLSVYPDGHLAIMVYNENRDYVDTSSYEKWWENYEKSAQFNNFGFNKLEIFPGNIGYLELNSMEYIELCQKTAEAAMEFLSNSKAIIIDLRSNPGGREKIVQLLISYFIEASIHYTTEISRTLKVLQINGEHLKKLQVREYSKHLYIY